MKQTALLINYGGGGLVIKSCLTLVAPWTVDFQAALFMEFSRQEYWSGLLFPSPGDPGIEHTSPTLQAIFCIAGVFFTT